jgi:Lrp/AsnC family leucine-responsive transcriptional regulator
MEALDKLDKQILRSLQADGRATYDHIDVFRASVQTWPEVVECAALTGEMDYLLRLLVRDMAHYSSFIMDTLLKHPSVQDCKTSFVMDRVKATTAVPL